MFGLHKRPLIYQCIIRYITNRKFFLYGSPLFGLRLAHNKMEQFHIKYKINEMILILKYLISHFCVEMFLAPLLVVFVFRLQLIRFARVCSNVSDFSVMTLLSLVDSSSWCHGLICSMGLWHSLVILTYQF